MKLPRPRLIVIIIFFIATLLMVISFNLSTPRVLILQSYSRNYPWSSDIDIGIRRILGERPDYALRWFYLDTDRHTDPHYYENIGQTARRLIDQWQPDIVIAIDDEAQEYVMKYYVDDPEIRIIFAGVNQDPKVYGYDQANNVTGILERNPLEAIKEVFIDINAAKHKPAPLPVREKIRPAPELSSPAIAPQSTQEICTLAVHCPRLFPQWQGIFTPAIPLYVPRPLDQIFSWSPLRLVPTPDNTAEFFNPPQKRDSSPARIVIPNLDPPVAGELRIIHLGDGSAAAQITADLIQSFDWHPLRLIESRTVSNFAQWQTAITESRGRADFLLITDYRDLTLNEHSQDLIAEQEIVQWTLSHSPVPIIATDGDFVIAGGYLAISASPFEQGAIAAQMALDLLNSGLPANSLPITLSREFTVLMRGVRLIAAGIHLPRMYETFSRATNTYWDD